MSLIQSVSHLKDDALNIVACPAVMRLGVQAIPASSLLIGEASLSGLLHYGVVLPSPIGIELLELPSKVIHVLERRRLILFRVSRISRIIAFMVQKGTQEIRD